MQSLNDRPPPSKRPRIEANSQNEEAQCEEVMSRFCLFQRLLLNGIFPSDRASITTQQDAVHINPPSLPKSLLQGGQLRNNISKWQTLFKNHHFRASLISSPRQGLSIYKDSFYLDKQTKAHGGNVSGGDESGNTENLVLGRIFLIIMFALHPHQEEMEKVYQVYFRNLYSLFLFCQRMRQVSLNDGESPLQGILRKQEEMLCCFLHSKYSPSSTTTGNNSGTVRRLAEASTSIPSSILSLLQAIHKAHPQHHRIELLQHEYQRILWRTSTLSNALVTFFQSQHQSSIDNMVFKSSPSVSKYERIAIYLYDTELDHKMPQHFLFLPSLHNALLKGPDAIVEEMIEFFWSKMLDQGYFATSTLRGMLQNDLANFFRSGLTGNVPLPLLQMHAHFTPIAPLSLYLYGKAGSGKSSLVRKFPIALEATIEKYADPEMLVRFVKQNLNKKYEILELEMELRPNNNDLSVMSIIQGRRMTMGQSKPGLVVVNLEEMPNNAPAADPNQLQVAQLISQRFGGRTGDFTQESKLPRNSDKRGIQNDASLITIFTSNYTLALESAEAMKRLPLFKNLSAHEIVAVSGTDRIAFAQAYLQNCINDLVVDPKVTVSIQGTIHICEGDTRPLVRHLRMISSYICELVASSSGAENGKFEAIVENIGSEWSVNVGSQTLHLEINANSNLYPRSETAFEFKYSSTANLLAHNSIKILQNKELQIILSFWLSKTLAPAVIVSNKHDSIKKLIDAVGAVEGITIFGGVDASKYKMMKSLYDPRDTPNLRDDILKVASGSLVAVELHCPSADSQLCIREMIEDSPSMTAFSTSKSALYKEGLLFLVLVEGAITPEVKSRASIIL